MIELMRQMLANLPDEYLEKDMLVLKGLYALPSAGYEGFKEQFKFNKICRKK